MDLQSMVNSMNEMQAKDRSNYHLTYGQLVGTLESAPKDAVVDERFKGIGSWRGSYIEIAVFTEDEGADWEDDGIEKLPTNANELGALLRSLIGKDFTGWKGGNYTIEEYKPLWLTEGAGTSGNTAIVGIGDDLKFVTKEISYE